MIKKWTIKVLKIICFLKKYYKYGKLLHAEILIVRNRKKIFFNSYEKNNKTNNHVTSFNQKIDI